MSFGSLITTHRKMSTVIAGQPQGVVFPNPQSLGIPAAALENKFQVQRFLSLCLTRTCNIHRG